MSEVFILNGKKEGEYKSYHKNGQLNEIVMYTNNKKNGERKLYSTTGQLWTNGQMDKWTNG